MIDFKGVRKEFDDLVAVRDLDLSIAESEIFGLIGPNGAGKTTLIKMACGLLAPTQGSIEIDGINVHAEPERAQRSIGYLADFFAVYEDLKVWEYLDYFANAYKLPPVIIGQRIDEVIEGVKLEVKRDALIKGLSRGMKQRLGIARAVIHRPKVLLLDEPASGLDPKSRIDLRNLLLGLQKRGTTILISSHILPDLEGFCTSIGIMERGQMLQSGRVDRLAQERPARPMRIEFLPGATVPPNLLVGRPGVSNVIVNGNSAEFQMQGNEHEVSALLTEIVEAGLPVTSFFEVKQTVEELYLKISHHEVM
jgi:ABC-2 type transport system ATP-binding protein